MAEVNDKRTIKTPNIDRFCSETGLSFQHGEVGFGRPCVGILDPDSDCYLDYDAYDDPKFVHDVAENHAPDNAYHKHPCLAVLVNGSVDDAVAELEDWMGKILGSGYEIKMRVETTSIGAFFGGGSKEVKCLVNSKRRKNGRRKP